MSEHGHYNIKCKRCGAHMGGCRCCKPGKEIRYDVCDKCKKALVEEYLEEQTAKEAQETVAKVASMKKSSSDDTMVKINGVSFRCTCGCNVFRKDPDYQNPNGNIRYICNGCKALWIGEK